VILDIRAWPADRRRLEPGQSIARLTDGQVLDRRFFPNRINKRLRRWVDEGPTARIMA
jgi:hypothetical protein